MARFILAFFEGAHDANFVARLLSASGDYSSYGIKVSDVPDPMKSFLLKLYGRGVAEDTSLGQPEDKMTPTVALASEDYQLFFFGFVTGGYSRTAAAQGIVADLMSFARQDEVGKLVHGGHSFGLAFFYDADDLGVANAVSRFWDLYGDFLRQIDANFTCPDAQVVGMLATVPLGLYVFNGADGFGTLEDCVLTFLDEYDLALAAARGYIDNHNYDHLLEGAENDTVASRAKRIKAVLTIIGQCEKSLAGSSLAVVLRKSRLLDGAFNFDSPGVARDIKTLLSEML